MKKVFAIALMLFLCTKVPANETLSSQATAFYSDNNYNKTMELILQIDVNERTAQDWLLLGNVLDDKGEKENAIFMYQKAIAKDPKFYKAYYNLANHYMETGKFNLAAQNYKKATALNKNNPYAFYNLACAYIKLNEINKAKTSLNKAIMLKNDVADFHYNLAYVYKVLNKPKLAEIYLKNYNKILEFN